MKLSVTRLILAVSLLATFVSPVAARRARAPVAPLVADLQAFSRGIEAAAAAVTPAVVKVQAELVGTADGAPGGAGQLITQQSTGSGVFLDPAGWLVTNAHVVRHARAVRIQMAVREADGLPGRSVLAARGEVLEARIVGVDEETDIAVLQVKAPPAPLPAAVLGDSEELRPGHVVLAFGSPRGLANSVTLGVVSAPARQLEAESPMIYVQTDAPINPGNSGGPLVDARGRVVGINTLIVSKSGGSEGLGFAVPSNIVRTVYEQVREHGRVRRGTLGLRAQTITPELAAALELGKDWGVLVADVPKGTPAYFAGLEPGDVVLSLDGKPMENARQLQVNLYGKPQGENVLLRVLRGEKELDVTAQVVDRGPEGLDLSELVDLERDQLPELGIVGFALPEGLAGRAAGLRSESGVVVVARLPGGSRPGPRLAPGDVIRSLNGRPTPDLERLRSVFLTVPEETPLVAHVERDAKWAYVALRP